MQLYFAYERKYLGKYHYIEILPLLVFYEWNNTDI